MSDKAFSIGALVGGAILGIATLGAGLGAFAGVASLGLIATGASGLLFSPKAASVTQAASSDVDIQSSDYGPPVSVLFGRRRVVGNIIRADKDTFGSTQVFTTVQGGKGGKKRRRQPVGFDYHMVWEIGFTVGDVDAVVNLFGQPGESPVFHQQPSDANAITISQAGTVLTASSDLFTENDEGATIHFSTGETAVISSVTNPATAVAQGSATVSATTVRLGRETFFVGDTLDFAAEGKDDRGNVRVYRGAKDQNRVSTGDPYASDGVPYRDHCWALFGTTASPFVMGRQPRPKTYVAELIRWPAHDGSFDMLRPDETAITGFSVRGSANPAHPNYLNANPAAIIYEVFTNEVWGRGYSATAFDEDSFIAAATYFRDNDIGMAFLIDQEVDVKEVVNDVMGQLRMVLTEDGGKLKLRVLTDISGVYSTIETFRLSQIREFDLGVPAWDAVKNQVTAIYDDFRRNYRSGTVLRQNLAAINSANGRINNENVSLRGFTDFGTASAVAARVLAEVSYPLRPGSFYVNRAGFRLEPGDVFRVIEDTSGQTVTIYGQVVAVKDGGEAEDEIQVEFVEDLMLPPVLGEETTVTAATEWPWDLTSAIDPAEESLDVVSVQSDDALDPIAAVEAPPILGDGAGAFVFVMAEKVFSGYLRAGLFYQVGDGTGPDFSELGDVESFAVGGSLLTTYNSKRLLDRVDGFDFDLVDPDADETTVLGFNTLVDPDEHFEALISSDRYWAIIGEEIVQIGSITKVAANHYRAANIARARFGTHPASHATSKRVFFMSAALLPVETTLIPARGVQVSFKAFPESLHGVSSNANVVFAIS